MEDAPFAVDGMTWLISSINVLIVLVRLIGIPAAVIYALVLLRRIARNTER